MEADWNGLGGRLTWTEGRAEGLVSHPVLLHVLDGSGADDGGRGERVRGERVRGERVRGERVRGEKDGGRTCSPTH